MTIRKALTIAGSDSGAGAGIQADLKTFAAFGVYGTSAITAITAQNTIGVGAVLAVNAKLVGAQIDAIIADIGTHAVKTGMLANSANLFSSSQDKLVSCHVIHQNGKLLRTSFRIDGHQSAVIITCKNGGATSIIRVVGGPTGPITISFTETDLPFDQGKQLRFSSGLKVFSIKVEDVFTGQGPEAFVVPDGWAGIIKIDN